MYHQLSLKYKINITLNHISGMRQKGKHENLINDLNIGFITEWLANKKPPLNG